MFIFSFPISSAAAAKVAEFRGIPEIPETFLKVFISSLPVISAAAAKNAEFREISEISENLFKVSKPHFLKVSAATAKYAEFREISEISECFIGRENINTSRTVSGVSEIPRNFAIFWKGRYK